MHTETSEITTVKKLKKDGSISEELIGRIVHTLEKGKMVLMPVDSIYAIVGVAGPEMEKKISAAIGRQKKRFQRLICSFRMLDDLACITKTDYDFLNRIWPGEITVILPKKTSEGSPDSIAVRFPRSKFLLEVISRVEAPLIFSNLYHGISKVPIFRKNEIIKNYSDTIDLIILIDELCRRHPRSTLIDICADNLKIIRQGKVSAEEIKSLYFLGRDDAMEY